MNVHKRKFRVLLAIASILVIGIFSFTLPNQPKPRNLKVLPQNISHDSLEHVMDGFKAALGVKCSFCHAPSKTQPGRMDPASDENPKKDIARDMMRMTMEINSKYISQIPTGDTAKLQMVTCATCHRGKSKPELQ